MSNFRSWMSEDATRNKFRMEVFYQHCRISLARCRCFETFISSRQNKLDRKFSGWCKVLHSGKLLALPANIWLDGKNTWQKQFNFHCPAVSDKEKSCIAYCQCYKTFSFVNDVAVKQGIKCGKNRLLRMVQKEQNQHMSQHDTYLSLDWLSVFWKESLFP